MQGEKGTLVTVDFLDLFDSGEFVEAFFQGAGPLVWSVTRAQSRNGTSRIEDSQMRAVKVIDL